MEETNRRGLVNLISFYSDVPAGFSVKVRVREEGSDGRKREKIERRYRGLKDAEKSK